ncbi:hypothetical protein RB200_20975 [Streptomyces sp. PmtG]
MRRAGGRSRRGRAFAAVAVAGAAGLGLVACDPVEGDMSTAAIALTTDKMGTRELQRQHLDVGWLNCTASFIDKDRDGDDNSGDRRREARVDCRGKTEDDKDITLKGRVTDVRNGFCVRGSLTAKVEQKQWFRVDVLGNCEGGGDDSDDGDDGGNGNQDDPPATHDPGDGRDRPRPTATVTVTERPNPTCCYPGK